MSTLSIKNYLSLVKFSHTIFALPFALVGYFLGTYFADYSFQAKTLLLVLGCMVFARSAAMAFNRLVDRDIDKKNPRTAVREIPAGLVSVNAARFFVLINCIAFVLCAYLINWTCFFLSPIALLVILGYSYTKRFTALCHFVLGLGLGLAPVGAFIAVTNQFYLIPILYGIVVFLWVAGFDIIYSLQDEAFDQEHKLNSVPSYIGQKRARLLSLGIHVITALLLILSAYLASAAYSTLGFLHWIGTAIFVTLIFYQHLVIKRGGLEKIDLAFFTTNGLASLLFGLLFILDITFL
jgi:4-hydroxybenzoate polyprenyltransferase